MYFIELERFGWNWLTVSSSTLFIVTSLQYRGHAVQAKRIWGRKSAESFSTVAATSLFFVFLAIFWYGLHAHSLVFTFTGGLAIPALFIMLGTWKYGRFGPKEGIATTVFAGAFLLYLTPINPGWILSGFSTGSMIPLLAQIREMYRTRTRGVVHGEWLLTTLIKNVFLVIFSFTAVDPFYMVLSPIYFGLTIWMSIIWIRHDGNGRVPLPVS